MDITNQLKDTIYNTRSNLENMTTHIEQEKDLYQSDAGKLNLKICAIRAEERGDALRNLERLLMILEEPAPCEAPVKTAEQLEAEDLKKYAAKFNEDHPDITDDAGDVSIVYEQDRPLRNNVDLKIAYTNDSGVLSIAEKRP